MNNNFSQYKKVFKHTIIYGFGNLSTKIVSFVLLPIFTRYLLPKDYGILELIGITNAVIIVILNFGLSSAIFKSYFNYDSKEKKELVISSAFFFSIIIHITLISILMSGVFLFSKFLFGSADYTIHFRLMLLTSFFTAGLLVPLALLRAEERSVLYICFTVAQLILMLSLNNLPHQLGADS